MHPGIVLPGLLGGVSLLLALLGLSIVPFSWVGIALLGLGLILLAAEAHVPAHGAFAAVGALSAALGAFMLFRVDGSPYGTISPVPIAIVTLLFLTLVLLVARKVVQARHAPPLAAGSEALVGSYATALTPLGRARPGAGARRALGCGRRRRRTPPRRAACSSRRSTGSRCTCPRARFHPATTIGRLERDVQSEPIPVRGAR